VFIYERNPEHACWVLEGTIKSPLAADPDNKTDYQGFGYRVDLSGDFAIIGTSVNNAYIYKEVSPGNWTLHTNLPPPAPGIFFGRSVALEGNIALVGAYGYGTLSDVLCVVCFRFGWVAPPGFSTEFCIFTN